MTSHRSTCLNPFCGTGAPHQATQCPKCGRQAFDDDEIARRGRHVLLLGLLLTAIMSGVFWMLGHGSSLLSAETRTRGSAAAPGKRSSHLSDLDRC